jgi:hypothetical protein
MKWQAVGDGLHEVQLEWDPKASSYFPFVVPKNLKRNATRKPFNSLSRTGKVEGSGSVFKGQKGSIRKSLGAFLMGQAETGSRNGSSGMERC